MTLCKMKQHSYPSHYSITGKSKVLLNFSVQGSLAANDDHMSAYIERADGWPR